MRFDQSETEPYQAHRRNRLVVRGQEWLDQLGRADRRPVLMITRTNRVRMAHSLFVRFRVAHNQVHTHHMFVFLLWL